ncbi:MAG: bla regulator protein blaR1 [Phycisphaerales bacterium]|jgi:beta-lactamase regulating signal transducer with metallopeptidase domain|nr:bla regulator protein blaR1 [Phycisphaerales bacterium]
MNLAKLDSVAAGVLDVLWRCSWQAAVLAGMVLIVQWLLRGRLSSRWRYNLWLLVLLRLLVPVTPQSSLSVFNLSRHVVSPAQTGVEENPTVAEPSLAVVPSSGAGLVVNASPVTISAKPEAKTRAQAPIPWQLILAALWIAGTMLLLARILYASMRLARAVRRMTLVDAPHVTELLERCRRELGVRRRVAILASADLPAPALMGVIRPRLLLPREVLDNFAPEELRLILLHELGHLKRNDVLVNWVVALLHALHWFNPVLWLAFSRLRADRELATDELVLSRTGDAEKSAYGQTILKLLQSLSLSRRPAPLVGAVGILERAHTLRRRITMIAHFRHHATRWTALAVVCMLVLAGLGLTDAVRGDDARPTPAPSAPSARGASPRPTSRESTTAPVNDKLRAIIDDVMKKALAKHVPPTADDMDEAMKELALRMRADGLIYDSQGRVVNEAQVYDEIKHAQELLAGKASKHAVPADSAATLHKLTEKAPEINFSAVPFTDTIDFLRDITGLNIFVNWRAVEAAGIERNAPVTVRLKNVPFEQALRYILRDAGGEDVPLDYAVVDGIVNISTADSLAKDVTVRVYSIAKLLKNMPSTAPADSPEQASQKKAESLIKIICETVAADSWRDAGGTAGSIREINGRLVITQTDANHAAIVKLLEEISDEKEDNRPLRRQE